MHTQIEKDTKWNARPDTRPQKYDTEERLCLFAGLHCVNNSR